MTALRIPPGLTTGDVVAGLATAEVIAAKDGSNLYFTSRFFTDPARREAFAAMYAVMRVIDDAVDGMIDKPSRPAAERAALLAELHAWRLRIERAHAGEPGEAPLDHALAAAFATFPTPLRLWTSFVDAMCFDVEKPRFETFAQFLVYGEGATVAPTAIYVYLLTSEPDQDGRYRVHDFDFEACGRDLGLFAYIAHVLRDVCVDLGIGDLGLFYLATDDLARHGLDEKAVRRFAELGRGDERWRAFVGDLTTRALGMLERGDALARTKLPYLSADRAFILRLIIDVYGELLRRIASDPECVLRGPDVVDAGSRAVLAGAAAASVGFELDLGKRTAQASPVSEAE